MGNDNAVANPGAKHPTQTRNIFFLIALPVAVLLALVGCLAWQGFLFPIHYVKYDQDGYKSEEGYRHRIYDVFGGRFEWMTTGKCTYYDHHGKWSEGRYYNGMHVGTWTLWNSDGTTNTLEENDERGSPMRTIKFTNGVPAEILYPDLSGAGNNSGTHWDDDRERRDEIEADYQRKLKAGLTRDQAREAVIKEYDLLKNEH